MATLEKRIEALELANPPEQASRLIIVRLVGTGPEADDFITGTAGEGRVPALLRHPGETVDALTDRAVSQIEGGGIAIIGYTYGPA